MTMMTTGMMVTAKTSDIPRAGETQEAARSVRERAPSLEQTQARRLARRRNASPPQPVRRTQKNPQAQTREASRDTSPGILPAK
jgi:hypothetical protein